MFRKHSDNQQLCREYVYGEQTLKQLFERYDISHDTITRRLDTIRMVSSSKRVVILIDIAYWSWRFGVVVIKDGSHGQSAMMQIHPQKRDISRLCRGHRMAQRESICD